MWSWSINFIYKNYLENWKSRERGIKKSQWNNRETGTRWKRISAKRKEVRLNI